MSIINHHHHHQGEMNEYRSKVALSIIAEYFGDVVHEVGEVMLHNDNKCSLAQIVRDLNDPLVVMTTTTGGGGGGGGVARASCSVKVGATVRQALAILNHHNCLSIIEAAPKAATAAIDNRDGKLPPTNSSSYLYSLNIGGILQRIRFPKLLLHVHKRFGSLASCLIEEVMMVMMCMRCC